jgi:RimJ/RimL family protein N-acetyltransferase
VFNFREVDVQDTELLFQWRMSQHVTEFMLTDIPNDIELHKKWLLNSFNISSYYHWIVELNSIPIGLVSISNYSAEKGTATVGFYIGEKIAKGLGAMMPPYVYNFLFSEMNINKIIVEVFYNNFPVIELHLLHGYKFIPENNRVVIKNKMSVLLVYMELNREDFNIQRFRKCVANFPMLKWKSRP